MGLASLVEEVEGTENSELKILLNPFAEFIFPAGKETFLGA